MSEEEIIKYIKDEIEDDKDTVSWFGDKNNVTRKGIEECIEAHQGLLDLYQKEKEKNEEGYKQLQIDTVEEVLKWKYKYHLLSRKIGVVSEDEIKELKEKNASLQKEIKLMKSININDNYISKDKIRELIEQLEDVLDLAEGEKSFPKYRKQALIEEIKDLQELLEERNLKCKQK